MSWYFRRSRKFGPFRVTVSKSGISTSVGAGGLRVTSSTKGTYFTASPGGGVYYRQRIGNRPSTEPPQVQPPANSSPAAEIASENVAQMVDHAAVLERINANESRGSWLPWLGYLGAFVLLISLSGIGLIAGAVLVVLCHIIRNKLPSRSPVHLDYQLDAEDESKHQAIQRSIEAIARCQRLWQVHTFEHTNDWKRNAGANQLLKRSPARAGYGTARSFVANIPVGHLSVKGETLYFLPDMILVQQRGRFGSVAYSNLNCASSACSFREEEGVPSDGQVIHTTWRFVNKDGGPDRRFNNNRQIPVVRYGEIALRSGSGLRLAAMTSTASAAETFVAGIRFVQSCKPVQMLYLSAPAESAQR